MKKILLLALAAFMTVMPAAAAKKAKAKKQTIAIVQQMNHNSLNTISDAIKAELAALGYNSTNSVIIFKQGDNDMTALSQIVEEYINANADVVIPVATKAANAALAAADAGIPVVFAACSDPVGSKLVLNMAKPEGFVTGTSNAIQADKNIDFALTVNPKLNKIGFIHTTGETNAQSTINKAAAYCKKINLAYKDCTIDDVSAIAETVKLMYDDGCRAVFLPNDNKLASHGNMAILSEACLEYKLPLYCGADSQVEDGGFANVGITYSDLGKVTADMADKILKGAKVGDVPVKVFDQPEDLKLFVNPDTLKSLSISLPASVTGQKNYILVKPMGR